MVHYFQTSGNGYFSGGKLHGSGARCVEDYDTGDIKIYMGSFTNGDLDDVTCTYLEINDDSFTQYEGPTVLGELDGNVTIISWQDLGTDPNIPEGNGVGNSHGKKHIYNSQQGTILSATKREVIYDEGTEISEISSSAQDVTIFVSQKLHSGCCFFNVFNITEV